MTWSTASPSTKRTDALTTQAGPGAAGAAPGPAFARASAPPHLRLPRRWVFAPLCGILVALCAVLAAWHAPAPRRPAGFDLRAAPASPNVDSNSAGAADADSSSRPQPPLDTPPGGQEELDKPRAIIGPAPAGPSAEPPPAELPPLPPAPPGPPMTLAPLLPPAERDEPNRDLQRGDSTMIHVKKIALPVALAAALSGQPLASAEDVEKPPTLEQTAKDVKELKEAQKKSTDALLDELKKIQDQLKSMEGVRRDVDTLRTTVQDLRRELELSTQMHNRTAGDLTEVRTQAKQLREELDRAKAQASKMEQQLADQTSRCDGLNREIAALRRQVADGSRQSARITEGTGTGTVRLYNTSGRTVSIILNGREPAYRLEPGGEAVVNQVPVGSVSYEVLGLGVPYSRTRNLTADNPLAIEVYDLAQGPVRTPPKPQP